MKISFVIPAHNEELNIGKCIGSIELEIRRAGLKEDAEIIVVDNASDDATARVAAGYTDARVIVVKEPVKGIVRARARGLNEAKSDLIANIDADNELPPGWLTTVMDSFAHDPGLVCITGPLIYHDLPALARFGVWLFNFFGFVLYLLVRFVLRNGSMVQGGNFVLKKSAWLSVGGYDTSIDFYGEDTDVARRLSRAGKVRWTFELPIFSSGRRLAKEGILATGWRYTLNYLWEIFLERPYTRTSKDIRPNT